MKGKKCLDVGAGTGFLSFILHDMGLYVVGLDLSIGMLSQARVAASLQKVGLSLCQADAECLPISSSSFDLVISRHLLWTLPDPQRAIAEWMRVLRPGGRIVAIDGNWFDPKKKVLRWVSFKLDSFTGRKNPVPFREYYHPIEGNLPLYRSSRPDKCQALFEKAGLKEISHDSLDEVNLFYSRNASHSYRLANSDAVFLVAGEKEC